MIAIDAHNTSTKIQSKNTVSKRCVAEHCTEGDEGTNALLSTVPIDAGNRHKLLQSELGVLRSGGSEEG